MLPTIISSALRNNWIYTLYKQQKASFSAAMYGHPSQDMFVVGITGTNGKTTTSFLIHHIFNTLIDKTFLIGTNEIKYGTESEPNISKMTSPDAKVLQSYLAQAKDKGCKIAVLEVASHGLQQQRFFGIDFDMGVLTNITAEHLDYHKTMDEYAETKKNLFTSILGNSKINKLAVFPKDDKYGKKRSEELIFEKMMTYSLIGSGSLKADNIRSSLHDTQCTITSMGQEYQAHFPLVGDYNVANVLAALSAGLLVGLDIQQMINCLSSFVPPMGRMQLIEHTQVSYFIDFAHTPDGLEKTLLYLTQQKKPGSRIIVLTGAMGDRDRYKRPIMGGIANEYADIIVLADEDPGDENRFQIIQEIKNGIARNDGDGLYIIPDRELAIKFITEITQPGDLVLLAGKGHETVMCIPGKRIPRDEKAILEKYLS